MIIRREEYCMNESENKKKKQCKMQSKQII